MVSHGKALPAACHSCILPLVLNPCPFILVSCILPLHLEARSSQLKACLSFVRTPSHNALPAFYYTSLQKKYRLSEKPFQALLVSIALHYNLSVTINKIFYALK